MRTVGERPTLFECPKCRRIYTLSARPDASKPTPCCGANAPMYQWPELGAATMLDIVASQDLDDDNQRKIAIVFLASTFEALIEDPIIFLLPLHYQSKEEALKAFEENDGKKRRISFFTKLAGKSLEGIANDAGFKQFVSDWGDLALVRNSVAHGSFFNSHKTVEEEKDLLSRLYPQCLPVFSAAQNFAVDEIEKKSKKAGQSG